MHQGSYETLEYALTGGVAVVRLNRPQRLNAISSLLCHELRRVLADIKQDDNAAAVVVTGNGRAFSAGADISELASLSGPVEFVSFIETIQTTFNDLEDLNRPTIAAINGTAYGGGCELALACDFRIMAQEAALAVPEIKIGVLPGAGGTQRLSHMLPPAIAKQMIYFGEPLNSESALRHGLVNEVVPADDVLDVALSWAARLTRLPRLAIRAGKLLVHGARAGDIKAGVESERTALAFLFTTADRAEGMQAFLDKREPSFTGR